MWVTFVILILALPYDSTSGSTFKNVFFFQQYGNLFSFVERWTWQRFCHRLFFFPKSKYPVPTLHNLFWLFFLRATKISLASDSVYFADSIAIFIFIRTRGTGTHNNTMLHISHRLHRNLTTLRHFSLDLMMSISSVFSQLRSFALRQFIIAFRHDTSL